jgi:hypothetical protein
MGFVGAHPRSFAEPNPIDLVSPHNSLWNISTCAGAPKLVAKKK